MESEVQVVDAEAIPVGEGRGERDRDHIITNISISSRAYGPGRPRTLGLARHTTIYLYDKYRKVYPLFVELAGRERKSFSELCSIAMKEYVELHYPGNPAVPLTAFTENGLKPARLEAKMVSREVEKWLKILENPDCAEYLKKRIRAKDLPPLILKLSRLSLRLRDDGLDELVERGEGACFGEGCA